jgi:hypothetical protein
LFLFVCMAPEVGLEPTTLRLTAECSAIELLRNLLMHGFEVRSGEQFDFKSRFFSYNKKHRMRERFEGHCTEIICMNSLRPWGNPSEDCWLLTA